MSRIGDLAVRHKLTLIILVTSAVALLTGSVVVIVHDLVDARLVMGEQLAVLAATAGANTTAALTFGDVHAATETLGTLRSDPHVIAACIYGKNGQPFARYRRDADAGEACPSILPNGSHLGKTSLAHFGRSTRAGESIGTVYIVTDLGRVRARVHRTLVSTLLALFGCLTLAFALASSLQKLISEPLQELACTARQVTFEKNYAIRATGRRQDEFGLLITSFNDMLEQIQVRELELKKILLAEDDPVYALLLQRLLEGEYEVFASTGRGGGLGGLAGRGCTATRGARLAHAAHGRHRGVPPCAAPARHGLDLHDSAHLP